MNIGKVYLVGAGPGDTGLITKRGYDLLKKADVIIVDALVNSHLLESLKARIIFAGKRGPGAPAGPSVDMSQSKINKLMIHLARQNFQVVRLKGGDPFLFGRGSEELEKLRHAHIPYEIVPGVTSALAVPSYAGIPITDRRWASQVTIVTGSEGKDKNSNHSGVDWKHLSPKGTLIFLMGVSRWPQIRKKLIARGWNIKKPVAAIESGTTVRQRVILTTLQNSEFDFKKNRLVSPSIIVVGDVASFHSSLAWVESERPLLGRRIVVTRPLEQIQDFVSKLEEKGAEIYSSPAIRFEPVKSPRTAQVLKKYLIQSSHYFHWVLLLSANAVENLAFTLGSNKKVMKRANIVAIGPRTAQAVQSQGWTVKKMAKDFNSFGIKEILGDVRKKRILIPRVQNAPPFLTRQLKKSGARVMEIATYRTLSIPPSLQMRKVMLSGVDAVTFTSGSTVRYLLKYFRRKERNEIFSKATAVSIGPMTTSALKKYGVGSILETPVSTADGMINALCDFFRPSH